MTPSRRDVIHLTMAVCGLRLLSGCGAQTSEVSEVMIALSDVPSNGVVSTNGPGCTSGGVLVGRDTDGLYAYSNVCTHEGGDVPAPDQATGESKCCLHGSRYDQNGDLISGIVPNQGSLPHYKVRIEGSGDAAVVIVSVGDIEPDRNARVAVPSS